jgi:hypothetical protein
VATPLPTFRAIAVESLSRHDRIRADGLEEYVEKYGWDGWLTGLGDNRPVEEAIVRTLTTGSSSHQLGWEQFSLRIKDVFLFYYIHKFNTIKIKWDPAANHDQRDAQIAEAVAEIKRFQAGDTK